MTITSNRLASGTGTGASVTVLTAPANTTYVIKRATLNNITAAAVTYTAVANDPGAREIVSAAPIAAGRSVQPPELVGLTLSPGNSLDLNLPGGVTYWISGVTIV